MSTNLLAVSAAGWGVLMALSPVLQIRAIVRRGSSHGVSIGYFVVLTVGFVLWLLYGAAIRNVAIVVPNSVALLLALVTIAVAAVYRRRPDSVS